MKAVNEEALMKEIITTKSAKITKGIRIPKRQMRPTLVDEEDVAGQSPFTAAGQ